MQLVNKIPEKQLQKQYLVGKNNFRREKETRSHPVNKE
jgi:hypothetical protein